MIKEIIGTVQLQIRKAVGKRRGDMVFFLAVGVIANHLIAAVSAAVFGKVPLGITVVCGVVFAIVSYLISEEVDRLYPAQLFQLQAGELLFYRADTPNGYVEALVETIDKSDKRVLAQVKQLIYPKDTTMKIGAEVVFDSINLFYN